MKTFWPKTNLLGVVSGLVMWGGLLAAGCPGVEPDTNTPQPAATGCEPAMVCADALPAGQCQGGRVAVLSERDTTGCSCQVFTQFVDCAARGERCEGGGCVPVSEACRGKSCPALTQRCRGTRAYTYTGAGVCQGEQGECDYSQVEIVRNCATEGLVCDEGRCVEPIDPCAGANVCRAPNRRCDAGEAVSYSGRGDCTSDDDKASCDFSGVEQRETCEDTARICNNGRCVVPNDLCEGVACDEPSAPTCDGMVAVSTMGNGTCLPEDGMCDYSAVELREDCARAGERCVDGACEALPINLCAGVMCQALNARCDGTVAVSMMGAGMCLAASGMCDYSAVELRTDCAMISRECIMGACVEVQPELCDGVMCPAPAASCDGAEVVTYTGMGTCQPASGMCSFATVEQRVDCALTGQTCMMGACQTPPDLCDGVMCPAPAASCDGTEAVTYTGMGTCQHANGMCDFSGVEQREDCALAGEQCMMGGCTP